jgi:hypothetical protein
MRNRKAKATVLIVLAVLLIGVPVLLDRRLAAKYARHSELVGLYECYPFPCTADFNGNGTSDYLSFNYNDGIDGRLTVTDNGQELFGIPYTGLDNTMRTHAAIHKSPEYAVPHLLIFDGTKSPRIEAAFVWDGEKMGEITPSNLESEIILAMAARDDMGGWNKWVMWRTMSELGLPVYCLLIGVGLAIFGGVWMGDDN